MVECDWLGRQVLCSDELSRAWDLYADRLLLTTRAFGEPAEDAVQEAFIKLAELERMPDKPMAWLVKVARNQLLQWWRSNARSRRRDSEASERCSWFDDEELADRIDAIEMTKALKQLSLEVRESIVLHLWGGLSFEQIGEILGVSRSTAHRQYVAAIQELKERFVLPLNEE